MRVPPRAKGDELITALFEAMHDLHFLRDALEGGDFCLALALESLPSKAALVHLYDIDRREFVIACTGGKGAEPMLLRRHPEQEPLLSRAMRKRRAIVIPDASRDDDTSADRFLLLGGAKSLIVAPVMQAGRFLGVIEMINPLDKVPFNEDEGAAIHYIAEQYAEFLAQRGVVVDPERITQRAAQPAAIR
jgi:GAF domain-containing protein